jgi:adenylate cyclase
LYFGGICIKLVFGAIHSLFFVGVLPYLGCCFDPICKPKVEEPVAKESSHLTIEEQWRAILAGDHPLERRYRRINSWLPSNPRCRWCNAPFSGPGARIMHLMGKHQSNTNPNFCNICDNFARQNIGGANIELSMLFADVRGSTTLAEQMDITEFSQLISRFYAVATDVLIRHDAFIDKLVGDQATGFFLPGMAGPDYNRQAVLAAQELLQVTGHANPDGPWVPVGVGVHRGTAFVGAVGSKDGIADITALGDAVNIAARLSSNAGPGEILVSEEAFAAAGIDFEAAEQRSLSLKGRAHPVTVRVLRASPNPDESRK